MSLLQEYHRYHKYSLDSGDIDPSHKMLAYICDVYELNTEQRYWLAFVYSLTYSGASTFYVYNEFPDFDRVDENRLMSWWFERGRDTIIMQTDRRWIRSSNLFVPTVMSYKDDIQTSQEEFFERLIQGIEDPEDAYDKVYQWANTLPNFGQFSLFLYLEALYTITDLRITPHDLDLDTAWSCRNGLVYAYDIMEYYTPNNTKMPENGRDRILECWEDLKRDMVPDQGTIWNLETTLCAYRKYKDNKSRYLGYYLDREAREIAKIQSKDSGCCWGVLWDYRRETYESQHLIENYLAREDWERLGSRSTFTTPRVKEIWTLKDLSKRIHPNWKFYQLEKTKWLLNNLSK